MKDHFYQLQFSASWSSHILAYKNAQSAKSQTVSVRNDNATFAKFNIEINYQSFAHFYLSDYYLIPMFTFPYNPFYPVMYIM